MAKIDLRKLREEAARKFPGDATQQRAYIAVMTPEPAPSTAKKPASTVKKKVVKKTAPPAKRRRRI
jgi:hypothetical protein